MLIERSLKPKNLLTGAVASPLRLRPPALLSLSAATRKLLYEAAAR